MYTEKELKWLQQEKQSFLRWSVSILNTVGGQEELHKVEVNVPGILGKKCVSLNIQTGIFTVCIGMAEVVGYKKKKLVC